MSLRKNILGIFSMSASRLLAIVLSLLTTTLIARSLSAEELGVYSILMTLYTYQVLVAEFGLRGVVMSEAAKRGSILQVLGRYIKLRLSISTAVYVLSLLACSFFFPQYFQYLLFISLGIFFSSLQMDWALLVLEQYSLAGWTITGRWFAYLLFIGCLVFSEELSVLTLCMSFALSWGATSLLTWLAYKKVATEEDGVGSFELTNLKLLNMGWPVLVSSGVGLIFQNADLIWIGSVLGTAGAGMYYIGQTVVTACLLFANVFGQMALGKYGRFSGEPQQIVSNFRKDLALTTVLALVMGIFLGVVAPYIIPLIFGEEYLPAIPVTHSLIPYLLFYYLYSIVQNVVLALGWQRQALRGLVAAVVMFPILFMLATPVESLLCFALMKGLLILIAVTVLLLSTNKEVRKDMIVTVAPPYLCFVGYFMWQLYSVL